MKIIVLIVLFSLASVFLFFKKDNKVAPTFNSELTKKVEVKEFSKSKFSKKLNFVVLVKHLEL